MRYHDDDRPVVDKAYKQAHRTAQGMLACDEADLRLLSRMDADQLVEEWADEL